MKGNKRDTYCTFSHVEAKKANLKVEGNRIVIAGGEEL